MKTNKKSFILYTDTYDSIKILPDLEKGRLLTAIFEYVMTGKEISTKSTTGMAFSFIKKQLDRDTNKWNALVSRNRANILSRWEKTKLKKHTKDTSGKSGIPNPLDSVNDNDIYTTGDKIKEENVHQEENVKEIKSSSPYKALIVQFNQKYATDLFPTFGKQAGAIKSILKSYPEADIWECADWLSKIPFWKSAGIDFTTILSQIGKWKTSKSVNNDWRKAFHD